MTAKTPGGGDSPRNSPLDPIAIKPRSKPLLSLPKKKKSTPTSSPPNARTPPTVDPPNGESSAAATTSTPAPRHKGLEMKAVMTVHTNLALQMWQGREQDIERDIRPIIGVTRFASGIAHVWNESARDNPMADWILLIAEERFQVASEMIERNLASLREILEGQEFFDDIESATNIRPVVLPLNFHCPWGYKAATLLKKFDDVVRLSLTATHLGLVSARDWEVLVRESARRMRGFLGVVAMDLRVHLERSWFSKRGSKKLASARQEMRKLGKKLPFIPQDVMSGERRAALSPAITTQSDASAQGGVGQKQKADVGSGTQAVVPSPRKAFAQPVKKKERTEWGFDFYRLTSNQPLVDLNQDEGGPVQDAAAIDQENAENE